MIQNSAHTVAADTAICQRNLRYGFGWFGKGVIVTPQEHNHMTAYKLWWENEQEYLRVNNILADLSERRLRLWNKVKEAASELPPKSETAA